MINSIETVKGLISNCVLEETVIATTPDFLDLMMSCPSDTIALQRKNLTQDFFDLKTGVAGEFLQKVSNYQKRLVILGDFSDLQSQSFQAFMLESNRTGKVIFAGTLEAAVQLLR